MDFPCSLNGVDHNKIIVFNDNIFYIEGKGSSNAFFKATDFGLENRKRGPRDLAAVSKTMTASSRMTKPTEELLLSSFEPS